MKLGEPVESGEGDFKPLYDPINQLNAAVREISDRLLSPEPGSLEADLGEIRVAISRRLFNLSGLLNRHAAVARGWLCEAVQTITMTPSQNGNGERCYVASGA